jgi:hypothetical protein
MKKKYTFFYDNDIILRVNFFNIDIISNENIRIQNFIKITIN